MVLVAARCIISNPLRSLYETPSSPSGVTRFSRATPFLHLTTICPEDFTSTSRDLPKSACVFIDRR
jgi:hypothetical protein